MEKMGEFNVHEGFVRDVNLEDVAPRMQRLNEADGIKPSSLPRQAVRILRNPNSSVGSDQRNPNLGLESMIEESGIRNKDVPIVEDRPAGSSSFSFAGKSSLRTSIGESTFVSAMNPSSVNPIDVKELAWSSWATSGIDRPTGVQSGMFPYISEATNSSLKPTGRSTSTSVGTKVTGQSTSIKLTKPVVILGVSIASKEELIGLVNKIESGALDEVISKLTIVERQAAHALVLELAKGFNYVNSESDTLSDEPNRVTTGGVSHIDPIVQSVSFHEKPNSYVGATRGSKPEPSKSKANFRSLFSENLYVGVNFSIPRKVVETAFSEDGLSIIVSQIESLTMGGPLIEGTGFTIETVTIEYEWKPPRCDLCKIFGHVPDHCPKKVSSPPIIDTPIVKKTNDGFQMVRKKRKKGKSKFTNGGPVGGYSVKQNVRYEPKVTANVSKKGATNMGNASKSSSMLKNQPLKAVVPPTKEGNITMSNSNVALDNESKEDVENVYDELANLLISIKTGESSSIFTIAVG
ncbi:hypothetical protein Tco_0599309 [Tanacetum coccineum]